MFWEDQILFSMFNILAISSINVHNDSSFWKIQGNCLKLMIGGLYQHPPKNRLKNL